MRPPAVAGRKQLIVYDLDGTLVDTPADQQRGFSTGADAYLTNQTLPA